MKSQSGVSLGHLTLGFEEISPPDAESPIDVDQNATDAVNTTKEQGINVPIIDVDVPESSGLPASNESWNCIGEKLTIALLLFLKLFQDIEVPIQDMVKGDPLVMHDTPRASKTIQRVILLVTESIHNIIGAFSLSPDYPQCLSYEPDVFVPSRLLAKQCPTPADSTPSASVPPPPHPFPNIMKRLAARDFEDILQCAMPIFEGLFPASHDATIQTLLFRFAKWHAYAKMRLHTEAALDSMSQALTSLTRQLQKFRHQVCDVYNTFELPREQNTWQRQEACSEHQNTGVPSSSPKKKSFNMKTYKFHAL
ncbi:uncharacterized protein EDB93DRAFT_1255567 [Suillus bovinus]|uniref:uncharacterized protein n=1 Tax=Suillus bovinus TaxID=48563 RepID=UPI001B878881|nr:uncharacterized protein EDB93DRAFT_1255567 [Suillus bovinus]KAG2131305.1 hypothetical protein EDB93DRAFT_1255567 [Suillus bovinus]